MTAQPAAPTVRHPRAGLLAIIAALATVLASIPIASAATTDWPGFQKDALHTGLATGSDLPDTLALKWSLHLSGTVKASPVVADGLVFVATETGNVYGVDIRNGRALWGPIQLAQGVIGTPAFESDRLYVATSTADGATGNLYVLNAGTGAILITTALEKGSYGGPVIHDGKLFVGHDGGKVSAFETESMTKLWDFDTKLTVDADDAPEEGDAEDDCCLTEDVAAKAVKTVPVVYEGRVYFGSFNHMFYAVSAAGDAGGSSSTVSWVENIHDIVYSSAAIHAEKDLAVVGSYDGMLYAFDADPLLGGWVNCPSYPDRNLHPVGHNCSDGIYWRYDTDSRIFSSPAVANNKAYVGDNDGTVHAVNLDSGGSAWSYKTGGAVYASPAVVSKTIVVGSYDGKVYMFKETADGALDGAPFTYTVSDKVHASPAISDGVAYVVSQDGVLYALAAPGAGPAPGDDDTGSGTPDLSIEEVVLTPRQAVIGQALEVAVTVKNLGTGPSGPFKLALYLGDALIDSAEMEVGADRSQVQSFSLTPAATDLFFRVVADEDEAVTESNEDNNALDQHATADPAPATDDAADDGGGKSGDEDAPGLALPAILAAVGLAALALRGRGARRP